MRDAYSCLSSLCLRVLSVSVSVHGHPLPTTPTYIRHTGHHTVSDAAELAVMRGELDKKHP